MNLIIKSGKLTALVFTCCVYGIQASGSARPIAAEKIITSARVVEGATTRTLKLKPIAPLKFLTEKLPTLPEPNASIVKLMLQYPRDRTHKYWWPKRKDAQYDGSTTDVVINGIRAMKGEPRGRTFCCGLTLELCYRMLDKSSARERFNSSSADEFKKLWFCRKVFSPGPLDALTSFSLGHRVDYENALPGDFVQIWRFDKSGHSVVFVAWAYDLKGNRVGIHYWSTQTHTNGINFSTELFGHPMKILPETKNKGVDQAHTTIARLELPDSAAGNKP
jgi:hypothetical protein